MRQLDEIRKDIDTIDQQIMELFEKRMELTTQVAEYKIANGKQVFDQKREEEKLNALAALTHSEENARGIRTLFETVMAISREQQQTMLDGTSVK